MQGAGEFRILFVCTGNICRSPFAELLARHLLVGAFGGHAANRFPVSSAGVRAVVGSPMHDDTRDELMPWGLDGSMHAGRFVARQLEVWMLEDADLVLVATPQHRSAVIERLPETRQTAFTVREFVRLLGKTDVAALPADPVERGNALVANALLRRGLTAGRPGDDAIPDPMGRAPQLHLEVAVLTAAALYRIVGLLAGRRHPPVPL